MSGPEVRRYPVTIDGATAAVGTANELSTVLDVLHGLEDRAVLEQVRPHLAEIVGGPIGFVAVMRSLEADDQVYLVDAIGADLVRIVCEARHLRDLLAILADSRVKRRLIDVLGGDGLRALVATPSDLAGILSWLYGDEDHEVLDLLGPEALRGIVRTADGLANVLTALDRPRQIDVLEAIGWDAVRAMVRDGRDLAGLLRALPAATSSRLLDAYSRDELRALIRNAEDWAYLYDRLESDEAAAILGRLGAR